jgi:hypothetical protein
MAAVKIRRAQYLLISLALSLSPQTFRLILSWSKDEANAGPMECVERCGQD